MPGKCAKMLFTTLQPPKQINYVWKWCQNPSRFRAKKVNLFKIIFPTVGEANKNGGQVINYFWIWYTTGRVNHITSCWCLLAGASGFKTGCVVGLGLKMGDVLWVLVWKLGVSWFLKKFNSLKHTAQVWEYNPSKFFILLGLYTNLSISEKSPLLESFLIYIPIHYRIW